MPLDFHSKDGTPASEQTGKEERHGLWEAEPEVGGGPWRAGWGSQPLGFRIASLRASVALVHGEGAPAPRMCRDTDLCWLWGSRDPLGVSLVFCSHLGAATKGTKQHGT